LPKPALSNGERLREGVIELGKLARELRRARERRSRGAGGGGADRFQEQNEASFRIGSREFSPL